jgi:TolA-binding protein
MHFAKALVFSLVIIVPLTSCSLLRRDLEDQDGSMNVSEGEKSGDERLFPATSVDDAAFDNGPQNSLTAENNPAPEHDVASLQTKMAALETRIEVLSANLEKLQLQRSQPIIEARAAPETNLAAPVSEQFNSSGATSNSVSAAPLRSRPMALAQSTALTEGAEAEFGGAMEKFQRGLYSDAGTAFGNLAQTYPGHLLAAHSLYWAGESGARLNQWQTSIQHWENLQSLYPRSTYSADSLVGLGRAYEALGNEAKASSYRNLALRRFPQSPVSLALQDNSLARGKNLARTPAPTPSTSGAEEAVPVYDGGSESGAEE